MSCGIMEDENEVKQLYIQTDLTDIAEIQKATREIKENAYIVGKEKYLDALASATPANLSKARKYHELTLYNGILGVVAKNFGWVITVVVSAVLAVIWPDMDWPDGLSLLIWAGIILQIYIYVQKSAWKKLTLDGAIIHPSLQSKSN